MSSFEPFESSAQASAAQPEAASFSSNNNSNCAAAEKDERYCTSIGGTAFGSTAAASNATGSTAVAGSTADDIEPQLKASGLLLTVQQAASILGKSVRALERSLLGRWGNKLPEGWTARKIQGERGDEWRIVPPPGFKLRSPLPQNASAETVDFFSAFTQDFLAEMKTNPKRSLQRSEQHTEHATIVIDRGDEVEHLLRELLSTQKALAEERRLHMEDLRIVAQLQGHMRLLESNSNETARIKLELEQKQHELLQLKDEYNQMLDWPWWKKILAFAAKKS